MPVKYPNGVGGGGGGGGTYTSTTPSNVTVGGIASGSSFVAATVQTLFDGLLHTYLGPLVSTVVSPAAGIREFGNTSASVDITPTTTRRSNNITTLTISRSGAGVIHTYVPNPAGGAEPLFNDATLLATTTTYTTTVGDGTSTSTDTDTYTFVYPFYVGVGAPGLTGAQIGALTKLIVAQGNRSQAYAPTAEVPYFAYHASYPDLSIIRDQNAFDVTADWTLRNPVVITGLDGTPQNYKVYEFDNLTSLAQTYTFNF